MASGFLERMLSAFSGGNSAQAAQRKAAAEQWYQQEQQKRTLADQQWANSPTGQRFNAPGGVPAANIAAPQQLVVPPIERAPEPEPAVVPEAPSVVRTLADGIRSYSQRRPSMQQIAAAPSATIGIRG